MYDENDQLDRFLKAQNPVYEMVLSELKAGNKRSHWMWFIFPQIVGLGRSSTSRMYAIKSKEEAVAYHRHPVLGERLRECASILLEIEDKTAFEIFGSPDDKKLKSSMTLFAQVSESRSVFETVLDYYFDGESCQQTKIILDKLR